MEDDLLSLEPTESEEQDTKIPAIMKYYHNAAAPTRCQLLKRSCSKRKPPEIKNELKTIDETTIMDDEE